MNQNPLHILVVDDSSEDRQIVRRLLTQANPGRYSITEVDLGKRALAACQESLPDCLLLDYHLPDMDGLAVLDALRDQSDVPVVVLTGVGNEVLAVDILQRGAQDYLVKGMLTPEHLSLTIQHAIATVRLTRERDQTLALLTDVLDTLPLGVIVLDAELRVRRVNPALLRQLSVQTAEVLLAQRLPELWPTVGEAVGAACRQVLASGRPAGPIEVATTSPTSEAGLQNWEISIQPLTLPDTGAPGLYLVVHEVTAQHQATAALQANEQWLRMALDIGQLSAWEWDVATSIVTYAIPDASPFGLPSGQHVWSYTDLQTTLYPPDLATYQQDIAAALAQGGPYQLQIRMYMPDDRLHWLQVRGLVRHDADGKPLRVVGVVQDISDQKQRELAQAMHLAISEELNPLRDRAATLVALAQLALSSLADSCVIYLCDDNGMLGAAIAYAGDPAQAVPLAQLPPPAHVANDAGVLAEVVRSGAPQIVAELSAERAAEFGALALRSVLLVPLAAHDRILGVIQLGCSASKRCYHENDLVFATALAQRGAEALIYAQLQEETRRVEHAAAEAHARLDALVMSVPSGIGYLDRDLRYQMVNPALARINGKTPAEHVGHTIGEMMPGLGQRLEPLARQVLATGEALRDMELQGAPCPLDGVAHSWLISYFPVYGMGREVTGIGVTVLDITSTKRIEAALEYERQQLTGILQTMREGLFAFRPDGRIALMNEAALRMFHLEGDTIPQTIDDVRIQAMPRVFHPRIEQLSPETLLIKRMLRGEIFSDFELGLLHPVSGEEFWIAVSGMPVSDEHGALLLELVTLQDITARKRDTAILETHTEALSRANAELGRALQLKDEFLAMMSHELRTPLTAILGVSEALDGGLYGSLDARQHAALGTITQSGEHLLAILSDILDLAAIESNSGSLERAPIDVERLCRTVLEFVKAFAQQKGISLLRTIDHNVEGLRADERRLTQILTNLLNNAVKFTPRGGTVGLEVCADLAQEYIQFVVWDTGIGIATADYERLFQPFTQVDGRLSRRYGGVGLGLTLVRRLVELHGGSISLDSTPGKGSRFTVSLPWSAVENVKPEAAGAAMEALPVSWARPPRVVIAEDHEVTLQFYADLLAQQGCAVTVARTGEEALAQVRALRPDVAILDIQMPGMDGLTAIRRIRADPTVEATPIIALTALAMPGDRERCLAAGATIYFTKPVSTLMLLATISTLIPPGSEHG